MAQRRTMVVTLALSGLLAACSPSDGEAVAVEDVPEEGEAVEPPFEVSGDAEGLLLVWFDAEGLHTAASRDEIPEGRRGAVRVDDLSLPPEDRLDPELVYVADLREPGEDGRYPVRRMPRAAFDARVERASAAAVAEAPEAPEVPEAPEAPVGAEDGAGEAAQDADVVLYGASWCGACRSAKRFLRARDVDFVERDIERDPGARQAMMRAAQAAGVRPSGIPVIDFRGEIITGFDRAALERAIERSRTPI
jgi:glutaredoxin